MTHAQADPAGRFERLRREGWVDFKSAPFIDLVGPLWERSVDGVPHLGFVAEPRHANRAGVVQGGMIATLADVALGLAARDHDRGRRQATIELNVQYIDTGRIGDFIVASGRVLRETRHIAFLSGAIEANGRIVASMSGVWKIIGR
ncbi:MAG: PaaI family thioesterase [Rhizobiaceae bacterium]